MPPIDAALALLNAGQVEALALTHDSLPPLAAQVPGSRILDAPFFTHAGLSGLAPTP